MSVLRIGGIASGFDTDKIVRDLMRVERMRVDRAFQQRQILQWQKEQMRGLVNQVRSFRDTYFDILRPTNIVSASSLKRMNVSSSDPARVTAVANADAAIGSSEFRVIQSAAAAGARVSGVTADSAAGGRISLTHTMEMISGKLEGGPFVFAENNTFTLTVNGSGIIVHKDDTLRSVLTRMNDAGVQASYSAFSDTFTFTAKATGEGFITTDDGGNFFSALGLAVGAGGEIGEAGRNAVFTINGFEGSRPANSFTIDGVTYAINKRIDPADNAPAATIGVSVDRDAIFQTIERFIADYNQLVDHISQKLREERFSDYPPLTDEQKEQMSERDIARWEERAQSGLLRRDAALETLLRNLRFALTGTVGEAHLSAVGIEFSRNFRDNGKLVLRDGGNALRAAIAENPDKVVDLFARRSAIHYNPNMTAEERAQRRLESGIAGRMSDVLQDNIRTTRNNAGRRGVLVERVGIAGDSSEFVNFFSTQIQQADRRINQINEMLRRKEDQYFRQFTAMEKGLQRMYAQSDWLAAQLQGLAK